MKVLLLPIMLVLFVLRVLLKIGIELSSIIIGGLMLIVFGCMFTVEEITLLRAFDTSTRRTAILSLMNEMGMMQDDELIAQCLSMVKKLENTTDTDFAGVDFTVYDDADNDEEADHE